MQTSKDAGNRPYRLINPAQFSLIVSVLVLFSLSVMETSSVAADTLNDTGYSRKQIVKMGLKRFTDIYCSQPQHKRHPNESAANVYGYYKQSDNKRRITQLSSRRRRQVKPFYTAMENWEATAWVLSYYAYGGGTARISDESVSLAALEEFLGQVIGCCERPQQSSKSNSRSPQDNQGISLVLVRFEEAYAASQSDLRGEFRQWLLRFRKQTKSLRRTLALQSPTVQRLTANYLNRFDDELK